MFNVQACSMFSRYQLLSSPKNIIFPSDYMASVVAMMFYDNSLLNITMFWKNRVTEYIIIMLASRNTVIIQNRLYSISYSVRKYTIRRPINSFIIYSIKWTIFAVFNTWNSALPWKEFQPLTAGNFKIINKKVLLIRP